MSRRRQGAGTPAARWGAGAGPGPFRSPRRKAVPPPSEGSPEGDSLSLEQASVPLLSMEEAGLLAGEIRPIRPMRPAPDAATITPMTFDSVSLESLTASMSLEGHSRGLPSLSLDPDARHSLASLSLESISARSYESLSLDGSLSLEMTTESLDQVPPGTLEYEPSVEHQPPAREGAPPVAEDSLELAPPVVQEDSLDLEPGAREDSLDLEPAVAEDSLELAPPVAREDSLDLEPVVQEDSLDLGPVDPEDSLALEPVVQEDSLDLDGDLAAAARPAAADELADLAELLEADSVADEPVGSPAPAPSIPDSLEDEGLDALLSDSPRATDGEDDDLDDEVDLDRLTAEPPATEEASADPDPSLELEPGSVADVSLEADPASVGDVSLEVDPASVADVSLEVDPASVGDVSLEMDSASVADVSLEVDPASVGDVSLKMDSASVGDVSLEMDSASVADVSLEMDSASPPAGSLDPDPVPEAQAKATSEPESEAVPESEAAPEPAAAPEPQGDPEPDGGAAEASAELEPEPEAEGEPEPAPEEASGPAVDPVPEEIVAADSAQEEVTSPEDEPTADANDDEDVDDLTTHPDVESPAWLARDDDDDEETDVVEQGPSLDEPWTVNLRDEVLPWPVAVVSATEVLPGEWVPPKGHSMGSPVPADSGTFEHSVIEALELDEASVDAPAPSLMDGPVSGDVARDSVADTSGVHDDDWLRGLEEAEEEQSVGYDIEVIGGTVDEPAPDGEPSGPERMTSSNELQAALESLEAAGEPGEPDLGDPEDAPTQRMPTEPPAPEDPGPPVAFVDPAHTDEARPLPVPPLPQESSLDDLTLDDPEDEIGDVEDEIDDLDLDEPVDEDPEPSGAHGTVAAVVATIRKGRTNPPAPVPPPARGRPRVAVIEARLWLDLGDPGPGPADLAGPLLLVDLDDPGPRLSREASLDAPVIQLDPDGDSITSLTIEPTRDDLDAYDPDNPPAPAGAEVVAEDGAVRVQLALGGAPPDLKSAAQGVAVAPARPIRRWEGKSEPDPDRSTDLVALARIEDGPPSLEPQPAVAAAPSGDDWLDAGDDATPMSPYFQDTGPILPPKPSKPVRSRRKGSKSRKK